MLEKIEILYEDKEVVVVNKPAGLLVHGIFDKYGPKHSEPVFTDWLLERYPEVRSVGDVPERRPGIVHRLDRETSGVMIAAKTQHAFEYLKAQFKEGSVKKRYLALTWDIVREKKGEIDKPISIKNGTVKRTVFKGKAPREALTYYTVLKYFTYQKQQFTLLEVAPQTGRTHQIRVHLSSIGHQIYGDKLYGKRKDIFDLGRHFLHAEELDIELPSGERKVFDADLTPELKALLEKMTSLDVEA